MKKLNVRKRKEKRLIWNKTKHYIILWIMACCLIISLNIHPTNKESISNNNSKMIYVFHDYENNQYILNNESHGSAENLDFLFDDTIPNNIKWKDNSTTNTESLQDWERNDINDNQISIEEIMNELWIDSKYSWDTIMVEWYWENTENNENTLIIDLSDTNTENIQKETEEQYDIIENWPILTIKKNQSPIIKNNYYFQNNDQIDNNLVIKDFQTISENRFLPSLISRDELSDRDNNSYSAYYDNDSIYNEDIKIIWWINILPDYKDCPTPRWYKLSHWESVLAYKQMENAPNICNIERRFCRNWKLSGTYPQQWCTTNENYTYTQRNDLDETPKTINSYKENTKSDWKSDWNLNKNPTIELDTKQNNDGSVTVYKPETEGSFIFDRPTQSSTNVYHLEDSIKESPEVEETPNEHKNCFTPWWEEVHHWQIVQAFKHANGFSDIPCEAQIRLCSKWELDGSYKQKTCKKREYSFADWYNGSANNDNYYKEKLRKIKQKIRYEEEYYKEIKWLSEEEALDKIFYLLDE